MHRIPAWNHYKFVKGPVKHKKKKKVPVTPANVAKTKPEWDSSISDLSAHKLPQHKLIAKHVALLPKKPVIREPPPSVVADIFQDPRQPEVQIQQLSTLDGPTRNNTKQGPIWSSSSCATSSSACADNASGVLKEIRLDDEIHYFLAKKLPFEHASLKQHRLTDRQSRNNPPRASSSAYLPCRVPITSSFSSSSSSTTTSSSFSSSSSSSSFSSSLFPSSSFSSSCFSSSSSSESISSSSSFGCSSSLLTAVVGSDAVVSSSLPLSLPSGASSISSISSCSSDAPEIALSDRFHQMNGLLQNALQLVQCQSSPSSTQMSSSSSSPSLSNLTSVVLQETIQQFSNYLHESNARAQRDESFRAQVLSLLSQCNQQVQSLSKQVEVLQQENKTLTSELMCLRNAKEEQEAQFRKQPLEHELFNSVLPLSHPKQTSNLSSSLSPAFLPSSTITSLYSSSSSSQASTSASLSETDLTTLRPNPFLKSNFSTPFVPPSSIWNSEVPSDVLPSRTHNYSTSLPFSYPNPNYYQTYSLKEGEKMFQQARERATDDQTKVHEKRRIANEEHPYTCPSRVEDEIEEIPLPAPTVTTSDSKSLGLHQSSSSQCHGRRSFLPKTLHAFLPT